MKEMVAEFAQVVGLISAFSSGRKVEDVLHFTDFLMWLSEHNHEEVRSLIEKNQTTAVSIKSLLNESVDSLSQKLDFVSEQIAILASHSSGFEELSVAFAKESLSDQSLEILSQMNENETEFFASSEKFLGSYRYR